MKTNRHPVFFLLILFILSIVSPLLCVEDFQGDNWISSWSCLGVFDNSDRKGMDRNPFQDFGSEAERLFAKKTRETILATSPTLIFKTAHPNTKGLIDFVEVFGEQNNKFAYAWTTVTCPMEGYAVLRAGSDDGIKAWINGKEILNHIIDRAANPDQELVPVILSKGENQCVVKLDQAGGDWGFYFCFTEIMPPKQGVHLKPVLDIIPPNIIIGSASPVHQFLYINLFNHGTVSGDNLRISCHSPILKKTFSESSDFLIRQITQVALRLESHEDVLPGQDAIIVLETVLPDRTRSSISELKVRTVAAHSLLQEKIKDNKDSFFIVQICDPHIVSRDKELLGVKTAERLEATVKEINEMSPAPDFVVVTGDLLLDNIEGYPLYFEIMSQLKVPYLNVFGNHDKPLGLPTSERIFSEKGLPPYYAFKHKGYWFYILDGVAKSNPPSGKISNDQMEWLDDLLKAKTKYPRLFFLHHDLFSGRGIENYLEVQTILEKHPGEKWFFSGHWHADCFVKKGDQRHLVTTSIGYLFDDGRLKHSRQMPGYRLIYLKDGKVSTKFKPLEKPALPDPSLENYYSREQVMKILEQ